MLHRTCQFEVNDIAVATTQAVRERLASGGSCVVLGRAGTGKSHAVRAAVNGALWVNLSSGSLQLPRFFVDLARQVDGGESILTQLSQGHLSDAFEALSKKIADRWLVVDRGELLRRPVSEDWDNPHLALQGSYIEELRHWLFDIQQKRSPVVIVSNKRLHITGESNSTIEIKNEQPWPWPLKLLEVSDGYRSWKDFADSVGNRPAGLLFGRALIPLLSAPEFNELVEYLKDEMNPESSLRVLAAELAAAMPTKWRDILALIEAVEGISTGELHRMLTDSERETMERLSERGLVETVQEQSFVLPAVRQFGLTNHTDRVTLHRRLRDFAAQLCDAATAYSSLLPIDADRILQAHGIYLRLGLEEEATKTARLHKGGLVDLARQLSLKEDFDAAHHLYGRIRSMLPTAPARGASSQRLLSYVEHYWAYNGQRAHTTPHGDALTAYNNAVTGWLSNAVWRKSLIVQLIRMGRLSDAREAVREAEHGVTGVPEHPRRAGHLRITPAWTALKTGQGHFGLELVDPVIHDLDWIDFDSQQSLNKLLHRWQKGVSVDFLRHDDGRIVFLAGATIRLRQEAQGWSAVIEHLRTVGKGELPNVAVKAAAANLKRYTRYLLTQPTWGMTDKQLRAKSVVISTVDLLNSDLGFRWSDERWLLGRIEEGRFLLVQDYDTPPMEISTDAAPTQARSAEGLYLGRVSTHKDGHPKPPVLELTFLGRGTQAAELISAVRRGDAHAE